MDITYADLPAINATLNGLSAILLATGVYFIRQKDIRWHRRMMLTAFTTSSLFLVSYLIYHAHIGSKPYPGTGILRVIYFSILIPHVVLAAVVLPMAIVTLARGLRLDVLRHRNLARLTYPIWMFVSISGVAVYLMLYW